MQIQDWKFKSSVIIIFVFVLVNFKVLGQNCKSFSDKESGDSILVCIDSLGNDFFHISIRNDQVLETLFSSIDLKVVKNTLFYRSRLDSVIIDTLYSFDNPKDFDVIYRSETLQKVKPSFIPQGVFCFDGLDGNIDMTSPTPVKLTHIDDDNVTPLSFSIYTNDDDYIYNITIDLKQGFLSFLYFSSESLNYTSYTHPSYILTERRMKK
ncbi:hypothetical protein WAF17_05880 [Bernardetia sp. ABR2-2B]|uniref:hypothetical protein n=1 Tax=Bernardetia sp. ABR2-2B TaxID=3127472 RepID=UPI0030CE208A